jgi:hypothetical protein
MYGWGVLTWLAPEVYPHSEPGGARGLSQMGILFRKPSSERASFSESPRPKGHPFSKALEREGILFRKPSTKRASFSESPSTQTGEHFRKPSTKRASFSKSPQPKKGILFRKPSTKRASLFESPRAGGLPFLKAPARGNVRYRITSKPKRNNEGSLFPKPFSRGLSNRKALLEKGSSFRKPFFLSRGRAF